MPAVPHRSVTPAAASTLHCRTATAPQELVLSGRGSRKTGRRGHRGWHIWAKLAPQARACVRTERGSCRKRAAGKEKNVVVFDRPNNGRPGGDRRPVLTSRLLPAPHPFLPHTRFPRVAHATENRTQRPPDDQTTCKGCCWKRRLEKKVYTRKILRESSLSSSCSPQRPDRKDSPWVLGATDWPKPSGRFGGPQSLLDTLASATVSGSVI
ncbi:hypothetical protein MTO96_013740 [Rhipicephalus appendiculatus]